MDGMVAVGPAPAASTQPLRQGATTAKPASEPVPNTIFNPTTQQSFTRGKLLGKGGFAKVYEAFEDATGTWFAIKVVDKKIIRSSSARQKLITEIKIHRSLHHQHIVRFLTHFEDTKFVYILLELCEGKTILDIVKKRQGITERETCFYMQQTLDAVEYMHKQNVIHRDLKLGNVFLSGSGDVKIGDFGLATVVKFDGDRKTTFCGTPNYIAPELLEPNSTHYFEVDVWSIGVMMFTMLVGRPPFETKSIPDTYERIRNTDYSYPENVQIADDAKDLIDQMLQRDPANRPAITTLRSHPFFERTRGWTAAPAPTFESDKPAPRRALAGLDNLARPSLRSLAKSEVNSTAPTAAESKPAVAPVAVAAPAVTVAPAVTASLPEPVAVIETLPVAVAVASTVSDSDVAPASPARPVVVAAEVSQVASAMDRVDISKQHEADKSAAKEETKEELAPLPSVAQRFLARQSHGSSSSHVAMSSPVRSSPLRSEVVVPSSRHSLQMKAYNDLVSLLEQVLAEPEKMIVKRDEESLLTSTNDYIVKWVDYSEKHGLGYQLSGGAVGVYMTDMTSVVLHPNEQYFQLYDHRTATGAWFSALQCPPEAEQKLTTLHYFKTYMQDRLQRHASGAIPSLSGVAQRPSDSDAVRLTKWLRTKHAIFFRLSNDVYQINFADHAKVIVDLGKRTIRYVDKTRESQVWLFAAAGEASAAVPQRSSLSRVKYVRDLVIKLIKLIDAKNKSTGRPSQ